MRAILLCLIIAVLGVNSLPVPEDVVIVNGKIVSPKIDITTFLPLYGGYQIKKLINSKTWGFVQKFIQNNPQVYASFKSELEPLGVFLPEFSEFNMNVLTPEDYQVALNIVGDTNIEQMLKPEFVDYLLSQVQQNKSIEERLMELIAATGITHSDNIDVDLLLRKIGKTFEPFIITFLPYAFQIIIFGK